MPSSYVDNVPPIVHLIIGTAPKRVVDVGCGWGLYGLACRQWLPELEFLAGVDVEEGRLATQDAIYDVVLIGDARHHDNRWWSDVNADLALLIDVIEHMPKADGFDLLDRILAGGGQAIVSTPKVWTEQHDDHNPFETHVELWQWSDLFNRYRVTADASTIDSIIYRLAKP